MTESKAREFWLDMQDDPYSEDEIWTYKPRHRNDLIHVIEKSAYDQLQSELKAKDELLRECEEAIRHMHYCKYWLNKSHEDCDCNMHLIVEKLCEGKK